jgi:protein arginine N-methyltransferase 2
MSTSTAPTVGELPEELVHLALALLEATRTAPSGTIEAILDKGAPAWYQDEALGWSCLHYAAERRDPELIKLLLQGGAVWNAVDKWGRTAGEISLSLGDREGWEVIRNEGIRSGVSTDNGHRVELIERDATSCDEGRHGRRHGYEYDTSRRGRYISRR